MAANEALLSPEELDALIRENVPETQAKAPAKKPRLATAPGELPTPEQLNQYAIEASKAPTKTLRQRLDRGEILSPAEEAKLAGQMVTSVADIAAGVVPAALGTVRYFQERATQALQRPEGGWFLSGAEAAKERERQLSAARQAQEQVTKPLESPFGRMFGVTETTGYQDELLRRFGGFIGENIQKGTKWIEQQTGLAASDVENVINALGFATPAAPKIAAATKATVGEVFAPIKARVSAAKEAVAEARAARAEPTISTAVPPPGPRSMGAAEVPDIVTVQTALRGATPELQQALGSIPINQADVPTVLRHIEADQLPVPIRLTEGQATGDVVKLSNEQNLRAKNPELAQRFNDQNSQLIDNVQAIRDQAAPEVFGPNLIDNGQAIIDAYKQLDADRSAVISKAYKDLEDANGGQFPVDGAQLAQNAERGLAKKLKTEFLPPSIKAQLERFKSGEPMTFENFEALRTNVAAEMRKADRANDGNASAALSVVRDSLESLPMTGEVAAKLKPLADRARTLARERFQIIDKDPAYRAAINDAVAAEKFVEKFVINGVNKNVKTMVDNLGPESVARQNMAAGTINWLRDRAGVVNDTGNFSQAGFNKALKRLDDVRNTELIFTPQTATQLRTLGNVARYTQAQPRGAFVNNSNTLVGAMADRVANALEAGTDVVFGGQYGFPMGSFVRGKVRGIKEEKATKKTLAVGAGARKE